MILSKINVFLSNFDIIFALFGKCCIFVVSNYKIPLSMNKILKKITSAPHFVKNAFMNWTDKRLKIITIIIGVVFAVSFIDSSYRELIPGFKFGFSDGYKSGRNQEREVSVTRTFFLSLKPEGRYYNFPTTTVVTTTLHQLPANAEIERMRVRVSYTREQIPISIRIAENFYGFFFVFITLFAAIQIPVQTFRIVRSITKNKVFEPVNVKRLRKIGYATLLLYIIFFLAGYFDYKIASYVVQVEGYLLQMGRGNVNLALLGLVILMFAEVLKVSVRLKEEQDLTV